MKFIGFVCALFRFQEYLHECFEANAHLLSPTSAYPSFEEISAGKTDEEISSIFKHLISDDCQAVRVALKRFLNEITFVVFL